MFNVFYKMGMEYDENKANGVRKRERRKKERKKKLYLYTRCSRIWLVAVDVGANIISSCHKSTSFQLCNSLCSLLHKDTNIY